MTKWKSDEILAGEREIVTKHTAGWTEDQLREKLACVLAAVAPIRSTLSGLINNPNYGRHGGMTVTSEMFMDLTLSDVPGDFPEPYGFRLSGREWEPVSFKWSERLPGDLQKVEASFNNGECLHPDTEILSVWQFATACSIFVGSFDASDVSNLVEACSFNSGRALSALGGET